MASVSEDPNNPHQTSPEGPIGRLSNSSKSSSSTHGPPESGRNSVNLDYLQNRASTGSRPVLSKQYSLGCQYHENLKLEPQHSKFYATNNYSSHSNYRRFSATTKTQKFDTRFIQAEKPITIVKNKPKVSTFRRKSVHDVALESNRAESKRVVLEMLKDLDGSEAILSHGQE